MIRRMLLGLGAGLALGVLSPGIGMALAQESAPAVEATATRVALDTSAGVIVLELDGRAPVTVENFLAYVDQGRMDGVTFYRAMDLGAAGGLIQGGPAGVADRILPPIAHEPTSQTGLRHGDGAISMARFEPGTATGDFFIIVGDQMGGLDARGDDPGFAAFGRVVEGMEVVRAILTSPRSPTAGEGPMVGQMLDPRIEIRAARRLP